MNRTAPPDSSDLARIRRALEKLDRGVVVALADVGNTQALGHEIAREHAERRGLSQNECSTIFWHKQSSDAFDKDGSLIGALVLHWSGDKQLLKERLTAELPGYIISEPDTAGTAFTLSLPLAIGFPDRRDEPETLRYLHELLTRSRTGHSDETELYLKELVRVGSERLAVFAAYLLPTFDTATIEAVLRRADEFVLFGKRSGAQIYQTPDHTLSRVLTSMQQTGHPEYQMTLGRWSSDRRVVFRRAAADHPDGNTARLMKLACDKDPTVRVFALRSIIGSVAIDHHSFSPAERCSALGRLVDLIATSNVFSAAHEECRLEFWHLYFRSEMSAEMCSDYSVRLARVREGLVAESARDDLDSVLRLLAEPP